MINKPISASETVLRDGKPFFIYALVCPLTLEVRYVGQTIDLEQRTRGRMHHNSGKYNGPLGAWLRTLGYLRPYKVILERGINRRVHVPVAPREHTRGRKPLGEVWLSSVQETKWIKRFRKTIVNKNRVGRADVDRLLTNPPLPWETRV